MRELQHQRSAGTVKAKTSSATSEEIGIEDYKITLSRPKGVSVEQMETYIRNAVLASVFNSFASVEMLGVREQSVTVVRNYDYHFRKEAIF